MLQKHFFILPILQLQIALGNVEAFLKLAVNLILSNRFVAAYFSKLADGFELFDIQAVFGGVWYCSSSRSRWREPSYQVPSLPAGRRGQLAPELNANFQVFPAEYSSRKDSC